MDAANAQRAARPFQGHTEVTLFGRWGEPRERALPAGSVYVPATLLAVYLLDPQSDDGLVTWNVIAPPAAQSTSPVVRVVQPWAPR